MRRIEQIGLNTNAREGFSLRVHGALRASFKDGGTDRDGRNQAAWTEPIHHLIVCFPWLEQLERMHHALHVAGRQRDHRGHRQPERQGGAKRKVWLDPQGFDAGKKITGRKRHILVDTIGLLLNVAVNAANIQA